MGFYISDHPIHQYKSIFSQYNIIDYELFENKKDILSCNIAATVLKVQEKKTSKGNSYGIIKFSDFSNLFELFIFSEVFENNRSLLIEGNSLMLTLMKTYSDENRNQKRINIKKIVSLNDLVNKPIKSIAFKFDNFKDLKKIIDLNQKDGETIVKIYVENNGEIYTFKLKNKRNVNNKLINSLNLVKNVIIE